MGCGCVLRVCVLLGIAGFIIRGRFKEPNMTINTVFGGLAFPHEIKIAGSRQYILGGGPPLWCACYIHEMTPDCHLTAISSMRSSTRTQSSLTLTMTASLRHWD